MEEKEDGFNQVAITLINHFDSVYYVDIETGHYISLVTMELFKKLGIPFSGDDFFRDLKKYLNQFVHENDIENVKHSLDKKLMKARLELNDTCTVTYRVIVDGKIIHMRHSEFMCQDKAHVILCLENIEKDFQKREVQKKLFEAANRMARFDELTGIRNKNAFSEYSQIIDSAIKNRTLEEPLGIVLCDINDLKLMNDTRGHSFGDEAIQSASRIICSIFCHSPVFRIGGDEFVIILKGEDFNNRSDLLNKLKNESLENRRTNSGPVIACGMAIYQAENDKDITSVFNRADELMYENKKNIKTSGYKQSISDMDRINVSISDERKRKLDALFGALCTVSGGKYIFLCDMRFDYSRWSLSLVDDFGMPSEYMYHANRLWLEKIHPEDVELYKKVVDAPFMNNMENLQSFIYRAKRADGRYVSLTVRDFILNDGNGNSDYFGGIVIPV